MFNYFGNAAKHFLLGIFIVFGSIVVMALFNVQTMLWLPVIANAVIMFIIELLQGIHFGFRNWRHSVWDFTMGSLGGLLVYLVRMML